MSWSDAAFADVFRFRNGKAIKPKSDGDFPAYGSNGLIGQSPDWMYENAIILGRVGAYCGSVELCHDRFWASDNTIVVEPQPDRMDVVFSYYYLKHANLNRHAGGAAQPLLTQGTLKGLIGSFPSRAMQRRIAEILSAYDDLIENNTRRIAILEDMARRLFEEWFGRDADAGEPEPVRIDALIDFDPKTKVAKEGRKLFLPMPCVPTNSMAVSNWEERDGNAGSKFLNGDTLLARITPCLENGKTAFVDFLPDGAAGFGSTEFIVMRGRVVPPEFVYCLARSNAFREHAIKSMSGATGRQRVSSAAVAQFEIASPQLEQLERFGRAAKPMFSMTRSLADANINLRTTRDLLLPKLISGEIEVRAAEKELEAAAA
ncbi:restriction endonuclease subunit S [Sphingobium sufflavum]|uniref:restriction endonuclease subunit S n=1 Tax=Sphingobium sufflavum TaxID=1129547 RepID=UPI001F3D57B7|nr:restriction endonuclease subunit S [Sphingobium sufflavum]MCE7796523.1 restriction endonuclease subunit S [Sphingobium sufflavum]